MGDTSKQDSFPKSLLSVRYPSWGPPYGLPAGHSVAQGPSTSQSGKRDPDWDAAVMLSSHAVGTGIGGVMGS